MSTPRFAKFLRRAAAPLARPALTKAQRWAIACGASLALIADDRIDRLRSAGSGAAVRRKLARHWSIAGPEDVPVVLESLLDPGHDGVMREALASAGGGDDPLARFLEKHRAELADEKGIKAWDLCRVVTVARWCFTHRYIDEEQAWDYIMTAAAEAQALHESWRDLAYRYELGRSFWRDGVGPGSDLLAVHRRLLGRADSPWRRLTWSTPLDGASADRRPRPTPPREGRRGSR